MAAPVRRRARRRRARRRMAVVPVIEAGANPPPCAMSDPLGHTCGTRCLPALARTLPPAPAGWAWRYGKVAPRTWSVWLQQVGAVGRFYVVGLAPVDTARELAAVIHAYAVGHRHQ